MDYKCQNEYYFFPDYSSCVSDSIFHGENSFLSQSNRFRRQPSKVSTVHLKTEIGKKSFKTTTSGFAISHANKDVESIN
jgi:hypothetical protein